ncbi:MAG: Na-Ca exchanger/integrin-beta4 [Solirubrobacterales bacterium]|nr:Na-Ca exchanger/integrin-beta4 [Solirubrobacterales bacterium]
MLAATVAIVLVSLGLALPAIAAAETFAVDSAADEVDLSVGAGGCATAAGTCTLRAAIEEADAAVGESSQIEFEEEGLFEGGAGATIVLGSGLPPITETLRINGHLCPTPLGVQGPCVGVDGPATEAALRVEGATGVEIAGLAVTGAAVGVEVTGAKSFIASRDWFGVTLTGVAGGDGTGIIVGPGSDGSQIGTQGLGAGNAFADGSGAGLEILGAAGVKVLSNYFGVLPDGSTPAANAGGDIAVASTLGHEASGIAIGTNLNAAAQATPGCDRGCNVIAGAGTSGIDLSGAVGIGPPVATTIAGNFIGLDAAGTSTVANTDAGILVGGAAETVIGGPKAGEANYLSGGQVGVGAGPAAPDLVVRGNAIGVGPDGTPSAAPLTAGIAVESGALPSVALEATIAGNRVRMGTGVGISQGGFGATIAGNSVAGGETGIETLAEDGGHGNVIDGNSVSGTAAAGIAVENESNEIVGNDVSGAGAAGVLVDGSHVTAGVEGNVVGGDAAGEENAITGSGGAAIEILNRENTETEVARSHGSLNGGPFIELTRSLGTDPKGPNFGIQPPAFATATEAGASGSGAEPEALVRVFRKQLPEPGELGSFLGEARADASGSWEVGYAEPVPPGTAIAATQTSEAAATSEVAIATTSGSGAGAGGSSSGGGAGGDTGGSGGEAAGGSVSPAVGGAPAAGSKKPAVKRKAPQTWVLQGTREGSRKVAARFAFDSDQVGVKFECKLDRGPFRPCRSPKRYPNLKPGRSVFEVRAISRSGLADPTPAKWRFAIR